MDDYITHLLNRQPDPLAHVRDIALREAELRGRAADVCSYQRARELTALAASARASYVLFVHSGFGYLPLQVAATFGLTGQADVVETDPAVVTFIEQVTRQQSMSDRVRTYLGTPENVLASLNGPYDMVILHMAAEAGGPRFEDLVRLTRTGGTIVIADGMPGEGLGPPPLLEALAADPRLLVSFPRDLSPVVAVRRR